MSNRGRGGDRRIHQGGASKRPSFLDLTVDDQGTIFVTGTDREGGRGTFTI